MPVKVVGLVELKEKKSIAGHFQVSGSNLIREGCHLVISSLYPVKNAPVSPQGALWFDFDYQGRYYTLEIDQAIREAEIREKAKAEGGRVPNP